MMKLFCDKLGWACFTAGTLVHTQVGLIPIEAIREGDLVWSKNPETGEVGIKRVESISRREVYITYEVDFGGQSVTTTAEHPFWVYGKGFVNADELTVGDEIVCDTSEKGDFHIEEITEIVNHLHDDKVAVYNFSVEDWHTYFVGEVGLWVHNAKCDITFKNGDVISKNILETKPRNSPNPDKWIKNGGQIEVKDGTWKYTDKNGVSVNYKDGYPDFKEAGQVRQEVDIGNFKNYDTDYKLADELAPNGPKSDTSAWHHLEDGKTLQEIDREIHTTFTHRGGMSLSKSIK